MTAPPQSEIPTEPTTAGGLRQRLGLFASVRPLKNLRGLPSYTSTPILILTTESSDDMKSKGRAAGATGWLVKPFDPTKLLEVIRKVIR